MTQFIDPITPGTAGGLGNLVGLQSQREQRAVDYQVNQDRIEADRMLQGQRLGVEQEMQDKDIAQRQRSDVMQLEGYDRLNKARAEEAARDRAFQKEENKASRQFSEAEAERARQFEKELYRMEREAVEQNALMDAELRAVGSQAALQVAEEDQRRVSEMRQQYSDYERAVKSLSVLVEQGDIEQTVVPEAVRRVVDYQLARHRTTWSTADEVTDTAVASIAGFFGLTNKIAESGDGTFNLKDLTSEIAGLFGGGEGSPEKMFRRMADTPFVSVAIRDAVRNQLASNSPDPTTATYLMDRVLAMSTQSGDGPASERQKKELNDVLDRLEGMGVSREQVFGAVHVYDTMSRELTNVFLSNSLPDVAAPMQQEAQRGIGSAANFSRMTGISTNMLGVGPGDPPPDREEMIRRFASEVVRPSKGTPEMWQSAEEFVTQMGLLEQPQDVRDIFLDVWREQRQAIIDQREEFEQMFRLQDDDGGMFNFIDDLSWYQDERNQFAEQAGTIEGLSGARAAAAAEQSMLEERRRRASTGDN